MMLVGNLLYWPQYRHPPLNILRLHSYFHAEYVVEVMRLDSPPGAQKRTCAKWHIERRSTLIKTSTIDDAGISHYRKNAYSRSIFVVSCDGCVEKGDTNCALHLTCMIVRLLTWAHLRRETHPHATHSVSFEHHRQQTMRNASLCYLELWRRWRSLKSALCIGT